MKVTNSNLDLRINETSLSWKVDKEMMVFLWKYLQHFTEDLLPTSHVPTPQVRELTALLLEKKLANPYTNRLNLNRKECLAFYIFLTEVGLYFPNDYRETYLLVEVMHDLQKAFSKPKPIRLTETQKQELPY